MKRRPTVRRALLAGWMTAVLVASLLALGGRAAAIDKFSVLKTADDSSITVGETARFTIVASALAVAGNTVENFTLTDQLPSGSWTIGGPDNGPWCSINASNLAAALNGVRVVRTEARRVRSPVDSPPLLDHFRETGFCGEQDAADP